MPKIIRTKNKIEYGKKYYLEHKEHILERSRINYWNNRQARNKSAMKKYYSKDRLPQIMLDRARLRARKKGIECSIKISDIVIPEYCPVLGIKMKRNYGGISSANSPSLDRIDPNKGYTKDNVAVISMKANRIKANATADEILKVYEWLTKYKK